jgi:hypothetical protein
MSTVVPLSTVVTEEDIAHLIYEWSDMFIVKLDEGYEVLVESMSGQSGIKIPEQDIGKYIVYNADIEFLDAENLMQAQMSTSAPIMITQEEFDVIMKGKSLKEIVMWYDFPEEEA